MKLTIEDARKLAISSQALDRPLPNALSAIEHLGYVQIDTISVVERAHHHILWNRDPSYSPAELDRLLGARKVFEYWSHAASYLPMKDYRFYLPLMRDIATGKRKWWFEKDQAEMKRVMKRIRKEGPLRAKDFDPPGGFKTGPWFTRKPAKKALEHLLMSGKLMISGRKGFQKVYDLTERVLPETIDTSFPHRDEEGEFIIDRVLRSHGVASEAEMVYLNRRVRTAIHQSLKRLLKAKKLVELTAPGRKDILYARVDDLDQLSSKGEIEERLHILSPFDSLVIQRKRLKWLFDFDYQIECYVPEAKRKFGYFCLPLFWAGDRPRMVGRVDAKAIRDENVLKIQSIHVETELTKAERNRFQKFYETSIREFARFNGCERVET